MDSSWRKPLLRSIPFLLFKEQQQTMHVIGFPGVSLSQRSPTIHACLTYRVYVILIRDDQGNKRTWCYSTVSSDVLESRWGTGRPGVPATVLRLLLQLEFRLLMIVIKTFFTVWQWKLRVCWDFKAASLFVFVQVSMQETETMKPNHEPS